MNLPIRSPRTKGPLSSTATWAGLLAAALFSGCGEKKEPEATAPIEDQSIHQETTSPEVVDEDFGLAEILVHPRDDIRVSWLREGGSRVYGRIRAPFDYVSENLTGSKFTNVAGQSTPTYDIRVTRGGYLYVLKGEKEDLAKPGRIWESRHEDLQGAWLDDIHRTKVEVGEELHMSWFELSFIAGDIVLKKWLPEEAD